MNSTASFTGDNAGFQLGQNTGQITNHYHIQSDDSKAFDPRFDKQRIEEEKGGLFYGSYCWVLSHVDFLQWRSAGGGHILWITGDPGKGKTMLTCGIINELSSTITAGNHNIAYFFCQANNTRINSATTVLRGLLYMLGEQQPELQKHIPQKFLDNENGWFELYNVLESLLESEALRPTYLIIDALDECTRDQTRLLKFLKKYTSSTDNPRVKWLVTSRKSASIEKQLHGPKTIKLCLDLNEAILSTAVEAYVSYKVNELARENAYHLDLQTAVQAYLLLNARGTFLWVALVCHGLADVDPLDVQDQLHDFPAGLDELYERMLRQIKELKNETSKMCKSILGIITSVYRPITLSELITYIDSPKPRVHFPKVQVPINEDWLARLIGRCGSFLTLQNRTVTLVHQSARDFLRNNASADIAPCGLQQIHYSIFSQSLQELYKSLRRDIYSLGDPAVSIGQITQPNPDPLAKMRYACVHWVDHLNKYLEGKELSQNIQITTLINEFVCQDLLHWLEALSLFRSLPEGAIMLSKLGDLLEMKTANRQLVSRVRDAYRFLIHHRVMIEDYPLQVYLSALIFSPRGSVTRGQFISTELASISGKPYLEEHWGHCLQTLEGHMDDVTSVAFSPDSKLLVSRARDKGRGLHVGTIKVWDTKSGQCLRTLREQRSMITSTIFSGDSKLLATASSNGNIHVWDTYTWQCLQTFQGHSHGTTWLAFSADSRTFASSSGNDIIVRDTNSWRSLQILGGNIHGTIWLAFSADSQVLASSSEQEIRIWNTSSWQSVQIFKSHSHKILSLALSPDSELLASSSKHDVKVWSTRNGQCLLTLEASFHWVHSVSFSADSRLLASAGGNSNISVWHARSGELLQVLEGHKDGIYSVVFSADSELLVSAGEDQTIKVWEVRSGLCLQILEGHTDWVNSAVFSTDSKLVASASLDGKIKVWDATTFEGYYTCSTNCTEVAGNERRVAQSEQCHREPVHFMVFSPDHKLLATVCEYDVKIWQVWCGQFLQRLGGLRFWARSVVFSADSQLLAFGDHDIVEVWDTHHWKCLHTLEGHGHNFLSVVFSPDSRFIAAASYNRIKLWNTGNGQCLQTLANMHLTVWNAASLSLHASAYGTASGRLQDWEGDLVECLVLSDESPLLAPGTNHAIVQLWPSYRMRSFGPHFLQWDGDLIYSVFFSGMRKYIGVGGSLQTLERHSASGRSLTLFANFKMLGPASARHPVKVRNPRSTQSLQTIESQSNDLMIKFSATNPTLDADRGIFTVSVESPASSQPNPDALHPQGIGMSRDCTWVTWNSKELLKLPSSHKVSAYTVTRSTICIGFESGKVLILGFDQYQPYRARA
ncbi:WD40 repeat-like protein [Aspergillus indologenus CBS 114.80]|uniref:WD40 repeat-like protein n=1 Tax=Aspergillus indologenus CBS 114.80 TaxID=1450541 RepID=A0A2V5J162_9EURO|nr:WD40 repeat-like protein [Aspergillus indologenus CBS 114.80]